MSRNRGAVSDVGARVQSYNRGSVNDRILVTCPYCGEEVELYLESDVEGAFVQDCEVCCNPWTVRVTTDGDDRHVEVRRGDGSE